MKTYKQNTGVDKAATTTTYRAEHLIDNGFGELRGRAGPTCSDWVVGVQGGSETGGSGIRVWGDRIYPSNFAAGA